MSFTLHEIWIRTASHSSIGQSTIYKTPKALVFKDDILFRVVVEDDNYRADALNFVANMSLLHPI